MTTPNVSIINEGLQIKGNLSTPGSLKVLGGIAGHTKCNDIIVAVMAIIKGNIELLFGRLHFLVQSCIMQKDDLLGISGECLLT